MTANEHRVSFFFSSLCGVMKTFWNCGGSCNNYEHTKNHWMIHFKWVNWWSVTYILIKLLFNIKMMTPKTTPSEKTDRKISVLSSPQQCKSKYPLLIMWGHSQEIREVSEVIVHEVPSPTISMVIFFFFGQSEWHKPYLEMHSRKMLWRILFPTFTNVKYLFRQEKMSRRPSS